MINFCTTALFWAHVSRATKQEIGSGQRLRICSFIGCQQARNAEVDYLDQLIAVFVFKQENVAWLEVAMNNHSFMGMDEPLANLIHQSEKTFEWKL